MVTAVQGSANGWLQQIKVISNKPTSIMQVLFQVQVTVFYDTLGKLVSLLVSSC